MPEKDTLPNLDQALANENANLESMNQITFSCF